MRQRAQAAGLPSARILLWSSIATMLSAVLLGSAIMLHHGNPPAIDYWWWETVANHRKDWMLDLAFTLDHLGGGWVAIIVVPLLIVAALVLTHRWRGAIFATGALVASAGVVQLLKAIYGRARPDGMLVASDFGAFPSGHVANSTTIAIVLILLFPRARFAVACALAVIAMALSRTLLSVHWATDTLGGALVGASVTLLLASWLLPWAQTRSGRSRRAPLDTVEHINSVVKLAKN